MMSPFHWIEGDTITVTTSTSSSTTALTRVPNGGKVQLRFHNSGTVIVFIRKQVNGASTTALITDLPLAPGTVEVLTVNNAAATPLTGIAMIAASGTPVVYVTVGDGI